MIFHVFERKSLEFDAQIMFSNEKVLNSKHSPKFQIQHWGQNSYGKVNHSQNQLLEHVQQFPAGYRHPRDELHPMQLSKQQKLNS